MTCGDVIKRIKLLGQQRLAMSRDLALEHDVLRSTTVVIKRKITAKAEEGQAGEAAVEQLGSLSTIIFSSMLSYIIYHYAYQ